MGTEATKKIAQIDISPVQDADRLLAIGRRNAENL
jgi:hypothetical protein